MTTPASRIDIVRGLPDDARLASAREVYLAAFGQAPYNETAEHADRFAERVRDYAAERQGSRLALASVGEEIVGFALGVTATPGTRWRESLAERLGSTLVEEIFGAEALEIVHVAVHPRHAGTGIGRALMRALEANATEGRGVLIVDQAAPAPARLYASEGWEVVAAVASERGHHEVMAKTFTPEPTAAATLQGLSSMATKEVLAQLAQRCTAEGMAIEFESGGGVVIADRIRAGEVADLAVLGADAMDKLADEGHVIGDSVHPLFRSEMVIAIAEGADVPDVSSPEALRELVSGDLRLGYSTGPSGTALLRLLDSWGLRPDIDDRLVQARPGVPVGRLLTGGEVDVGFQQNSELAGMPGVRVLGPLPGECAVTTIFSGGVLAASAHPDAAAAALAQLGDPVNSAIVTGCGMRPAGG